MSKENIDRLKAVEAAVLDLTYPVSSKCADLYFFLDRLRQIGNTVAAVREALEKEAPPEAVTDAEIVTDKGQVD